jgi:hypothetical protein
LPADSTVADNAGVHELLWECAHIQLQIVHDLTFSQQGVLFPACFRARASCNMWDQSIEKLIEEVENHKKLWEEVCTDLIENWNGRLLKREKKTENNYLYFR